MQHRSAAQRLQNSMKKSLLPSAILLLLISGCSGNPKTVDNTAHESMQSSIQNSQMPGVMTGSWIRVDRQADWPADYKFPSISFEYPSGWNFRCCGDMDHASQHTLCADDACDKTYVKITDFGLRGCPASNPQCGIDEQGTKTAQQKYDELVSEIRADSTMQILHVDAVPALGKSAFRFENADHVRSYLVNLGDAVIEVAFPQNLVMNGNFVNEFLSRMTWDRR